MAVVGCVYALEGPILSVMMMCIQLLSNEKTNCTLHSVSFLYSQMLLPLSSVLSRAGWAGCDFSTNVGTEQEQVAPLPCHIKRQGPKASTEGLNQDKGQLE